MNKVLYIFLGIFLFAPAISLGSVASDFKVNGQSTYTIPYGIEKVLVFDLTLPVPTSGTYQIDSVSLHNIGTVDHTVVSKLVIWEDGQSVGWDGDETMAAALFSSPFFDTKITGDFRAYAANDPWRRIFVTIDLKSDFTDEKTLQLQLLENSIIFKNSAINGPTDAKVIGFMRTIHPNASIPTSPVSPIAKNGEALSTSTIRWYFTDLSNNEFGFKVLDGNLKEVARAEKANLSYLDETGLNPNTEYSGRQVFAFNDRGESLSSSLAVFSAAKTLALPIPPAEEIEEELASIEATTTETGAAEEEAVPEKSLLEQIQEQIIELQKKVAELLIQLNELLQQQTAEIWQALSRFLGALFGK